MASTPFRNTSTAKLQPFDLPLDPTGKYLSVVDGAAAKISSFAVSGGALNELSSSLIDLPGGATPFGIVVN